MNCPYCGTPTTFETCPSCGSNLKIRLAFMEEFFAKLPQTPEDLPGILQNQTQKEFSEPRLIRFTDIEKSVFGSMKLSQNTKSPSQ